ncbi:MAG: redoxin family protein [Armatimonadetes bacterium]|nr:redoxin family protein [Armatimonadota bacterium]CUU37068.1 Thiol-disulfide isomerase or thioredoxin [Armatimonadetes bacterium DC]
MKRILLLTSAFVVLALGIPSHAQTLKEGDTPPPIKVARWIKGEPVTEFRKDHVYVVEFWATWCGPCRQSIPHLTELAKKHQGKVTIIGVSVWERVPIEEVEKFVRNMGEKMNYTVAADDSERTMAKTWMEAAQQRGIPTAFVIAGGRIVWIGHPMAMDEPLEEILKGTFNWQEAARKRQEAEKREALIEEALQGIQKLVQQRKFGEAVAELDKFLEKHPDLRAELAFFRFNLLIRHDESQAYAYARQLLESEGKENPFLLNAVAWTIAAGSPDLQLKQPDYALAVQIAERAVQLRKDDPNILDTLAYAYFKKGEIAKAIETQRKAVALAEKDPQFDRETLNEMRERLAQFEKASQQPK